jgi:hypothetical protein
MAPAKLRAINQLSKAWVVSEGIECRVDTKPAGRGGMQELPTLGGDFGEASTLNEFGNIVGRTTRANDALRATLWTPTAGPLAVDPTDEGGAPEVAASPGESCEARAALCALGRKWGEWSRYGSVAGRVCLAR